uniref:Uncharacterized protein n=1 Tax=Pseudomonas sp. K-62 TaxID=76885 RepID=I2FG40_9PSED|nr:hypothetical protein [Pseudomonas sp. K-62]BAM13975.1 hypothetical protein [Pseudomonas sp. K-62]
MVSNVVNAARRDFIAAGLAGTAAIALTSNGAQAQGAASKAPAGSQTEGIVVGREYGRTPYSGMAEKLYEQTKNDRKGLDTSEFYVVTMGYLREHVCMGQCNLHIQILKEAKLREAMLVYRKDVCEPNVTEMRNILDSNGYKLPAPYNAVTDAKTIEQLGELNTDAINDKMVLIGHIFAVEGFMNRWNQGAELSHRADVRDAFVRNWHRANRWHLAALAMAEQMKFLEPQPSVRM